eukprot:Em0002g59a
MLTLPQLAHKNWLRCVQEEAMANTKASLEKYQRGKEIRCNTGNVGKYVTKPAFSRHEGRCGLSKTDADTSQIGEKDFGGPQLGMPPKNSKKRQVSEPKKPVKPHGKPGGIQRTPLHAYDKAANQDLYNVQDIIAERQEKDDTWEPIEHLAGAEEYIARFVEARNAAANRSEEEHAAKRAKRRECAEQHHLNLLIMMYLGDLVLSLENLRLSNKADKPRYKCLLSLDNGAKCDTVLVYCGGTTNMATHLRTRHSKYVLEHEMKSQTNTLKVDTDKNTLLMGNMSKWTPERRHLLCRKIAYWLVKQNRPLTLVERDTELRDVFLELSGGRFDGCSHHEIQKHLLQMVAVGTKCLKQQISDLVHDGLQLALAADFWSDGTDCALLGVFLYWIDKDAGGLFECLFSEDEAEAEATDSTDTEKYMAEDELEAYLVCPDEAKETDILMWWKTKSTWPKLQLMARQYLAVPATSAGVERLFSKASLAHGDLAKAMKEETLSFALFASYNYAPSMYEGFQM